MWNNSWQWRSSLFQHQQQGLRLHPEIGREMPGDEQAEIVHGKGIERALVHLLFQLQQGGKVAGSLDLLLPVAAADIGGKMVETEMDRRRSLENEPVLPQEDILDFLLEHCSGEHGMIAAEKNLDPDPAMEGLDDLVDVALHLVDGVGRSAFDCRPAGIGITSGENSKSGVIDRVVECGPVALQKLRIKQMPGSVVESESAPQFLILGNRPEKGGDERRIILIADIEQPGLILEGVQVGEDGGKRAGDRLMAAGMEAEGMAAAAAVVAVKDAAPAEEERKAELGVDLLEISIASMRKWRQSAKERLSNSGWSISQRGGLRTAPCRCHPAAPDWQSSPIARALQQLVHR
jgi:hypothetical protein